MPRFFVDSVAPEQITLTGEDARHISRSLRCRVGEELVLCDGMGTDARCKILALDPDTVTLSVSERQPSAGELPLKVTLYQAIPKSDKLEQIVQKAVELGVAAVVPVLTRYCVSRPDGAAFAKKQQRLQKIATEAAKQSGRGCIPQVGDMLTYKEALAAMAKDAAAVLFYERATETLGRVLEGNPATLAIMVGSEGGFDPEEAETARAAGVQLCTMGPRILRCETAPLYAMSAIGFHSENR